MSINMMGAAASSGIAVAKHECTPAELFAGADIALAPPVPGKTYVVVALFYVLGAAGTNWTGGNMDVCNGHSDLVWDHRAGTFNGAGAKNFVGMTGPAGGASSNLIDTQGEGLWIVTGGSFLPAGGNRSITVTALYQLI